MSKPHTRAPHHLREDLPYVWRDSKGVFFAPAGMSTRHV